MAWLLWTSVQVHSGGELQARAKRCPGTRWMVLTLPETYFFTAQVGSLDLSRWWL